MGVGQADLKKLSGGQGLGLFSAIAGSEFLGQGMGVADESYRFVLVYDRSFGLYTNSKGRSCAKERLERA